MEYIILLYRLNLSDCALRLRESKKVRKLLPQLPEEKGVDHFHIMRKVNLPAVSAVIEAGGQVLLLSERKESEDLHFGLLPQAAKKIRLLLQLQRFLLRVF